MRRSSAEKAEVKYTCLGMEGSLEQVMGGGFGMLGSESVPLTWRGECPREVATLAEDGVEGEVIGRTTDDGTISAAGKRAVNVEEGWEIVL